MPEIRDLIRGEFSQNIRLIFEHGLKKWTVLGGTMHPWSFINEAAKKNIEKEFDSVYSRLVLCKTFRLDEDGKVLTPDELLFRSIQLVNLRYQLNHLKNRQLNSMSFFSRWAICKSQVVEKSIFVEIIEIFSNL